MKQIYVSAAAAKRQLAVASTMDKNDALMRIAQNLEKNAVKIISENSKDVINARLAGLNEGLIDRLMLDEERIKGMADGVRTVALLDDPVGKTLSGSKRPNGLEIHKVTVPLGVIGMIYEARPNVTSDAAALCLKSGNAVILRGGKEAIHSNTAIAGIMREALKETSIPVDAIQLIEDTTHASAQEMMKMNGYIDVLIPRGSARLIRSVVENATVPIIETGTGNCHVYVDEFADLNMAADIVFNAKTTRISVCNSCESLVVHEKIAAHALPMIQKKLQTKNVEIRGDETACQILDGIVPATEEDFGTEYLDYIISVKVVKSLEEAISHINRYSTGHSDSIVTASYENSRKFMQQVDSAAVYTNASTRFTDGGEFGEGAEIGISTQKLHARGPMGLAQLTSVKYLIFGNGQTR